MRCLSYDIVLPCGRFLCGQGQSLRGHFLDTVAVAEVVPLIQEGKVLNTKITVLVADDNEVMREMITDTLYEDTQIEVCGVAKDGQDTLRQIHAFHPDIVLLDLIMPCIDGIGVMETVSGDSSFTGKKPYFIVVSAAGREDIISGALQSGASYFLMKPFDGNALIRRIKQIYYNEGQLTTPVANPAATDIDGQIVNILKNVGVPVKMVGYKYLKDAILLAVEEADSLMSVTKNIYPHIAQIHGTSAGNVERNIRYVIESTYRKWSEPRYRETAESIFHSVAKKPTNSEFILMCQEWIQFGGKKS